MKFTNKDSKYPSIDCSNDTMMVKENLRVPKLEPINIERFSKEEIKEAKRLYKQAILNKFKL